ncbi:MAG: prolyl oligopeptidase family serine peptidase [Candidatus Levybacteria bacterium]|nr:prolyl oligopeptidase family serine peptidase [Candidatus Levybacteria bacterium]
MFLRNTQQAPTGPGENQGGLEENLHPLSIEYMRQQSYPGSDITIEQTLPAGSNYNQYIASYKSDGLKIYALLTVPQDTKPKNGWPVIIFNHGFIPPDQYRTTERYVAYVDAFAGNGYIVFKSDYRGHGNSEGKAEGGYGSNAYTIDVLNALASLKREGTEVALRQAQGLSSQIVNYEKIGMWGHSMGGGITLRSMVISKDIKAGVIWAGVVGSYSDLVNNWRRRDLIPRSTPHWATSWRQNLIDQYGTPEQNPQFWNSISANSYLNDISGPIQLHHAKDDSHVPFSFSEKLNSQLQEAGKTVEFYSYEGDDHNLTNSFGIAMDRSIAFFEKYVKGGE